MHSTFLFLILTLLVAPGIFAATDICDVIKIPNCPGVTKQLRRTTFPTAPSNASALNLNPSNVSFDRGVGLDLIYQSSNPLLYTLASGTGKMGGALISGSMDNSFFGNRAPELAEDLLNRQDHNQQFRNKKLTAAIGAKLYSRPNVGFDIGLIFKRHPEIRNINMGAGFSGRLYFLHFGASTYLDDAFVDLNKQNTATGNTYASEYGKEAYKEKFTVTTYTVGTRIMNFAIDYGVIRSKLDFYARPTNITLISTAFHHGNFLYNLAFRNEDSSVPAYKAGKLIAKDKKSEVYTGVQYSVNEHLIFGLNYNYFLLQEFSFSTTLFL
jgi:hypothetical protein